MTTTHVKLGPAAASDPRVSHYTLPDELRVDGCDRVTKADTAVEVRYDGLARNTVDRLIRRGELAKATPQKKKES